MTTNSTDVSAVANVISRTGCIFITLDFDNISTLPSSVSPTWIFLSVLNGIAAPPTVTLNLLVIWTVLEHRRHRSANYNLLLVALAVTDLAVGLVVEPLFVLYLGCLLLECASPCYWYSGITFAGFLANYVALSTLMVMSVERFLAIEYPMYYIRKCTDNKIKLAVVLVWVTVPIVFFLARNIFDDTEAVRKIPTVVFASSNALIILLCTIKVHLTAYRQRKAIARERPEQLQVQQNRLKEFRRTFAFSLMVLASVFLYCPLIILDIVEAVEGKEVTDDFRYISQAIALSFVHLQSLVNPVIFSLRLSYIREVAIIDCSLQCWGGVPYPLAKSKARSILVSVPQSEFNITVNFINHMKIQLYLIRYVHVWSLSYAMYIYNLPYATLQFDGTPQDQIDKSSVPDVTKFSYLKELVNTKVRNLIDGLPFTNEGYDKAKQMLERRYGNPSEVVGAYVRNILELPTVTERNVSEIHDFYEKLLFNVESLQTLNSLEKLDAAVRYTFDKLAVIKHELAMIDEKWSEWTFTDFLQTLEKWSINNPTQSDPKVKEPTAGTPRRERSRAFYATRMESTRSCLYCNSADHKAINCDQVVNVAERKRFSPKSVCASTAQELNIVPRNARAKPRVRNVNQSITRQFAINRRHANQE
ncbi:hypothetical protein QZH41_004348 [Actinostola sp. cb2023]|nr:hypothetical protein QZH41_004348 [Actinostola sp. cb2023]